MNDERLPSELAEQSPHVRSVLAVDVAGIVSNWRKVASVARGAHCAAVVKANAYGTGPATVAALASAGCATFFVASFEEALAVASTGSVVYVLDGLLPGADVSAFAATPPSVRPVLSSLEQLRAWAEFAGSRPEARPAAVHVDTGMSRLGLPADEVAALAAQQSLCERLDVALVMTHPASADDPGSPQTRAQFEAFARLRQQLPPWPASFANSAAALSNVDHALDLVRPGIALYGGRSLPRSEHGFTQVVSLFARVLQVRTIPAGTPVGYGATAIVNRPSRIATLAVGYADGYPRALSTEPQARAVTVRICGHEAPIIGRISMDLTTIDVTDLPGHVVAAGTWATVVGSHLTVDNIADRTGTIGYEILTGLAPRSPRVVLACPVSGGG